MGRHARDRSQVRTRPIAEVLTQTALSREIERVRKVLPPVPGRKWVLTKVGEVLGDLALAAMTRAGREGTSRGVASELVCRAHLGRTRVVTGGMVVTAILTLVPAANESIVVTARSHGIDIAT